MTWRGALSPYLPPLNSYIVIKRRKYNILRHNLHIFLLSSLILPQLTKLRLSHSLVREG